MPPLVKDPAARRDVHVIGLVSLAHGTSHFYHLALAALFPWLKDAFALSYAELGLLMTVFFIVSGTGTPSRLSTVGASCNWSSSVLASGPFAGPK